MRSWTMVCIAALLLACVGAQAQGLDPSVVSRAAQRGLGVLVRDGLIWQQQSNCMSCHVHGLGIAALAEARQRGYTVPDADAAVLIEFAKTAIPPDGYVESDYGPVDAATYIGEALTAAKEAFGTPLDEQIVPLALLLTNLQRVDGAWAPEAGRNPMLVDAHLTTRQAYDVVSEAIAITDDNRYHIARRASVMWAVSSPSTTVQAIANRLAWLTRSKSPSFNEKREELITQLEGIQNPDGGWGLEDGSPSNVYSTGQVLWAMARAGRDGRSPSVSAATGYLLAEQLADGSWAAGGNVLSYAATAWATRALCTLVAAAPAMSQELASLYETAKISEPAARPPAADLTKSTVVLTSPPPLQWGVSGETTLVGCVAAALQYMGEPKDYAYLLAVSGAAFELRWARQGIDVAAGTVSGERPMQNLLSALGRQGAIAGPGMDETKWGIVTAAIDAGRPCIMGGPTTEHGLVVGYDPGKHQVFGYFYTSEPEPDPQRRGVDSVPYVLDLGPRPAGVRDELDVLAATLKLAIDRAPGDPTMAHGLAAYDAWARCLRDGTGMTPGEPLPREYVQANEWVMDVLLDSRRAAVAYLKQAATELPSATARLLLGAAAEYERLLAHLDQRDFYVYTAEPGKMPVRQALATPEGRERLARLLEGARDIESSATDELLNSLRAIGGL